MTQSRYEQRVARGSAGAQGPYATATVNNYFGAREPTVEELPAPVAPDSDWLMAQPSRLLDARSHVVSFTGR
ncbi:hypothetical protein ACUN3E_29565 [Streptomyces sp. Ju416(a)]